ncbi:MAG: hypothetical protein JW829_20610 [Pirellulales bacterium]|nr:hypothetical protein [Pirellulales bacterium]
MNIRSNHFERLEDRRLLSLSTGLDQLQLLPGSLKVDFCREVEVDAGLMTAHYAWKSPELHQTVDMTTGELVESISIDGTALVGEPGEVLLPVVPAILALPCEMTPGRINVSVGLEHMIPGEHALATGGAMVAIRNSTTTETPHARESGHVLANDLFEIVGIQRQRGVEVLMVNLRPVQYDIDTGRLSYFDAMDISIQLESATSSVASVKPIYRADDLRPIMAWVDNPQQLDSYTNSLISEADESGQSTKMLGICDPDDEYRYVIITNGELANATTDYTLRDLAEYHETHGLTSIIVTTQTIYENYTGVDNPEQIRNFIIDAYNNWETDYVLLGGDTNIIPSRELYSSIRESSIPSDLYFQCLDGSYDEDSDQIWGENTDGIGGADVDLLAEVYVGRAPAENADEMANWVYKNLTYANDPVSQNRLRAVMVGEYLGFGGVSDFAKDSMEEIRLGSSNHGYTTSGFASDPRFTTSTLYDADSIWSTSQLMEMMNSDTYGIYNHLGHADTNYSMKMYNSDVDALANGKYFLVYSQGCWPGDFPDDAIAEHFTTSTRNGAFAGVFNSHYGWGLSYSTDGPSQRLNREFWDAYFHENMTHLGPMNADSHEDLLWDIGNEYIRWVIYESNLFGDPAIDIGVDIDGIDLIGASLQISPDDLLDANGVTEATFILMNSGNTTAGPSDLKFYLSDDEIIDPDNPNDIPLQLHPSDPNFNFANPEIYRTDELSAFGQCSDTILLSVPVNDPFKSSNKYYIGMVVDASNEIVEVFETNNKSRNVGLDLAHVNYNATIFDEDMSTHPNWIFEGDWAWGIPSGNGGDPTIGYTDDYVIGYNLNGGYANDLPATYVTTPVIDCSGYNNVTLSLRRWLGIESSSYDHASIEVSTNGVDWITVWNHGTGSIINTEWIYQEYDISEVADDQMTVFIRWGMGPTDDSVASCGWNIDDVLVTGTPLGLDVKGPVAIGHMPSRTTAVLSAITFQFNESMDTDSFSFAEDLVSFTGPSGDLISQVTGFHWIDTHSLEVQFIEQSTIGAYAIVIGPDITDDGPSFNAMNQDRDAINGEVPDDRYTANFEIVPDSVGPSVIRHVPGTPVSAQSSILFEFNESMDPDSFHVAEDVISFVGPSGDLISQITGFQWIDTNLLEVHFVEQSVIGTYTMVVGPNITDDVPSFNTMNQDGDPISGEIPDDCYTASFEIINVLYSSDLETNPNWTLEGDWAWGIPAGNSGDPSSGHTGDYVIGYNLHGDYPDNLSATYATTPSIDCLGYYNVTLSFHRWLGIESSSYDHASVEVSNDGNHWTTVWNHNAGGFTDTSWIYQEYDISAVADNQPTVYVRWGMGPTNNRATYCGWNIDDVLIFTEIPEKAGPSVTRHTPNWTTDVLSSISFEFNESMDTDSFRVAEDVISFTGPSGDLVSQITGFQWIDPYTLEVHYIEQSMAGAYTMVLGPNITDDGPSFNSMDQDGDTINGEIPDDCYTASFGIIDVLYAADMSLNPKWTLEGEWDWGIPTGWRGDPNSGHTGDYVIGYNLNGDYRNNLAATYATTPVIDCSGRTDVTLSFYRWLGIESSINDHASIEVSNDGTNWTTIWGHNSDSCTDKIWIYQEYDISAVADDQPAVFVRWGMGSTNNKVTSYGWNIDDVLIFTKNTPVNSGPSVIAHAPKWATDALSSILFQFNKSMDPDSFSVAEDVVSFLGPSGDLISQITGFHWIGPQTLEVHFIEQSVAGAYTMVIGPNITDAGPSGNAMDQDGDSVNGEIPDDCYTALFGIMDVLYSADMSNDPNWILQGDWAWGIPAGNSGDPDSGHTGDFVIGYNLKGSYRNNLPATCATTPAIDCSGYSNITLSFYRWLGIESSTHDHASIEVSNNGVDWTAVWYHDGDSFTDTSWVYQAVDISAVADDQPMVYVRWGMGPTDFKDRYCGWNIDDVRIEGTLRSLDTIGPSVTGHTPHWTKDAQSSILFQFNKSMNTDSFSLEEDVISFTGPSGDLMSQITGFHWIDTFSLEVQFIEQSTLGTYTMVLGPNITDASPSGNAMNQDGDPINGEIPDDCYTGSFGIMDVLYAVDMSINPNWTLQGEWAWGIPAGNEGDPNSGHTGDFVIGYNLTGDYPNYLPATYATTPVIDCSGYGDVTLSFYRWLGIESSSFDHASVEVSNDGDHWTTVWNHITGSFTDTSWIYQEVDISEIADDQPAVYVRWAMGPTDYLVTYCGWNIDDVVVVGKLVSVAGDFNDDLMCDHIDFGIWSGGFARFPSGGATLADGDADRDGDVDGNDFLIWQRNFGRDSSIGFAAGLVDNESSLDLPQFQSPDARRPFPRSRAVDAIISEMDEQAINGRTFLNLLGTRGVDKNKSLSPRLQ